MSATVVNWPRSFLATFLTVATTKRLGPNLRALALLLLPLPLLLWPLATAVASCLFSFGVGFLWPVWATVAVGSVTDGRKLATSAVLEPVNLAKMCALEVWRFNSLSYFLYLEELCRPYYGEPLDVSLLRLLIALLLSLLCSCISSLGVLSLGIVRLPFIIARVLGEWMALLSKWPPKLMCLWLPLWVFGIPVVPAGVIVLFLMAVMGNFLYLGPTCGVVAYIATASRPAYRCFSVALFTALEVMYAHLYAMDEAAVRLSGLGSSSLLPAPSHQVNGRRIPYVDAAARSMQPAPASNPQPAALASPPDRAWSTFEDLVDSAVKRVLRWGWVPRADLEDAEAYLFIGLPALALLQLLADAASVPGEWMPTPASAGEAGAGTGAAAGAQAEAAEREDGEMMAAATTAAALQGAELVGDKTAAGAEEGAPRLARNLGEGPAGSPGGAAVRTSADLQAGAVCRGSGEDSRVAGGRACTGPGLAAGRGASAGGGVLEPQLAAGQSPPALLTAAHHDTTSSSDPDTGTPSSAGASSAGVPAAPVAPATVEPSRARAASSDADAHHRRYSTSSDVGSVIMREDSLYGGDGHCGAVPWRHEIIDTSSVSGFGGSRPAESVPAGEAGVATTTAAGAGTSALSGTVFAGRSDGITEGCDTAGGSVPRSREAATKGVSGGLPAVEIPGADSERDGWLEGTASGLSLALPPQAAMDLVIRAQSGVAAWAHLQQQKQRQKKNQKEQQRQRHQQEQQENEQQQPGQAEGEQYASTEPGDAGRVASRLSGQLAGSLHDGAAASASPPPCEDSRALVESPAAEADTVPLATAGPDTAAPPRAEAEAVERAREVSDAAARTPATISPADITVRVLPASQQQPQQPESSAGAATDSSAAPAPPAMVTPPAPPLSLQPVPVQQPPSAGTAIATSPPAAAAAAPQGLSVALGHQPLPSSLAHQLLEELAEHVLNADIGFSSAANPLRLYKSLAALQASPLEMRYMACHTVLLGDQRVGSLVPLEVAKPAAPGHKGHTPSAGAAAAAAAAAAFAGITGAHGGRPGRRSQNGTGTGAVPIGSSRPASGVNIPQLAGLSTGGVAARPETPGLRLFGRWSRENGGITVMQTGGGPLGTGTGAAPPGAARVTNNGTLSEGAPDGPPLPALEAAEAGTGLPLPLPLPLPSPLPPRHPAGQTAAAEAGPEAGLPPRHPAGSRHARGRSGQSAGAAANDVAADSPAPAAPVPPTTASATAAAAAVAASIPGPVVPSGALASAALLTEPEQLPAAHPMEAAGVAGVAPGCPGPTWHMRSPSGGPPLPPPPPPRHMVVVTSGGAPSGGCGAATSSALGSYLQRHLHQQQHQQHAGSVCQAAPSSLQPPLGGNHNHPRWPFGKGHRRTRSQPVGVPAGNLQLVPPSPRSVPGHGGGGNAAAAAAGGGPASAAAGILALLGYPRIGEAGAAATDGAGAGACETSADAAGPDAVAGGGEAGAMTITAQRLAQLHAFTAAVQSVATALSKKPAMKEIMGRLLSRHGACGSVSEELQDGEEGGE